MNSGLSLSLGASLPIILAGIYKALKEAVGKAWMSTLIDIGISRKDDRMAVLRLNACSLRGQISVHQVTSGKSILETVMPVLSGLYISAQLYL